MGFLGSSWKMITSALLEYETQKVVQIHSKKVGAFFRLIQLFFVLYVILWVMIKEKGYQKFDKAQSGVTAKLKGVAFANATDNPAIGAVVWDAADYVIPPQQKAAFFVMTNLIVTPGQTLDHCEESHDVWGNDCKQDTDCRSGKLVMLGSGVQTGRCVNSTRVDNLRVCEIYGWCPTEYDVMPKDNLLASAPNFTVILKNSIEFPLYKVKRRNILTWMNKKYLYTCRYDPKDDKQKFCPIFRLADIIRYTEADNQDVWRYGGMVSIHIEWNCNLDYDEADCVPKYIFRRLDDFKSPVGKGWNFRFSHHYIDNGVHKRNLVKAYGIQFFITVYGNGGKFDMLTFTMNLGSGLALLGIATVLCDMIILNVTRKRNVYRNAKVDLVVRQERKALRRQHGKKFRRRHDDDPSKNRHESGENGSDSAGGVGGEGGPRSTKANSHRRQMPQSTGVGKTDSTKLKFDGAALTHGESQTESQNEATATAVTNTRNKRRVSKRQTYNPGLMPVATRADVDRMSRESLCRGQKSADDNVCQSDGSMHLSQLSAHAQAQSSRQNTPFPVSKDEEPIYSPDQSSAPRQERPTLSTTGISNYPEKQPFEHCSRRPAETGPPGLRFNTYLFSEPEDRPMLPVDQAALQLKLVETVAQYDCVSEATRQHEIEMRLSHVRSQPNVSRHDKPQPIDVCHGGGGLSVVGGNDGSGGGVVGRSRSGRGDDSGGGRGWSSTDQRKHRRRFPLAPSFSVEAPTLPGTESDSTMSAAYLEKGKQRAGNAPSRPPKLHRQRRLSKTTSGGNLNQIYTGPTTTGLVGTRTRSKPRLFGGFGATQLGTEPGYPNWNATSQAQFRPDRGLFVGVPQSVVQSLLPPNPQP